MNAITDFYKTLFREMHICMIKFDSCKNVYDLLENMFCMTFLTSVALSPLWVTILIYLVAKD